MEWSYCFQSLSFKKQNVQFKLRNNYTLPKHKLNNSNKNYYESECTYFNINLFSLGYSKKSINPDIRVRYVFVNFFEAKYATPSIWHLLNYIMMYFMYFYKKRNQFTSNYIDKEIKMTSILENWYLENKHINKNLSLTFIQ